MASRKPPKKPIVPKDDLGALVAKIESDATPVPPFVPLTIAEIGPWDPKTDLWREEGEPVDPWLKPVVKGGKRTVFELELVTPGNDGSGDGPIPLAIELAQRGRVAEARAALQRLIHEDVRCIDAHAHLGNLVFDRDPRAALAHYATGATIALRSLGAHLDGVLWWLSLENRPFQRCLHGVGLCWWRLARTDEAAALFRWMLWLNPNDNQGARMLLDDLASGGSWAELHGEPPAMDKRSPRSLPRNPTEGRRPSRSAKSREWVGGIAALDPSEEVEIALWLDETGLILDDGSRR